MLVRELIDQQLKPLRKQSTLREAAAQMETENMRFFPIVDDETNRLVGQASMEDIREYHGDSEHLLGSGAGLGDVIRGNSHVMEAARLMLISGRTALPVVDSAGIYLGLISKIQLVDAVTRLLNLGESGTVIMVELKPRDFMLSDIIRIIESEGARILCITIQAPDAGNENFRVSVKLNLDDLSRVGSALRRYGYLITMESAAELADSDLSDKADAFMRYLDI
jgi:acetoin utilization protein AcuB